MRAETLYKMCVGKSAYRTLRAAEAAMNRSYEKRHVRLRVYNCPNCLQFHLTARVTTPVVATPQPEPPPVVVEAPPKKRGVMVTLVAEQMKELAIEHKDISRKKLKQMAVNRLRKLQQQQREMEVRVCP